MGKNTASRSNPALSPPLVVDVHKYYCFDAPNKGRSPAEIASAIPNELSELAPYGQKEVGTVIGEYSCALAEETWARADAASRPELVRQVGHAEAQRWDKDLRPVGGGSFFWTAKMEWMDGGEWGFAEQAKKGNVPPPVGRTLSAQRAAEMAAAAKQAQATLRAAAIAQHAAGWAQHAAQGHQMEHWRFEAGYDVGFWDAATFWEKHSAAGTGADTIGLVNLWVGKRLRDHVAERGAWASPWLWEVSFASQSICIYRVGANWAAV